MEESRSISYSQITLKCKLLLEVEKKQQFLCRKNHIKRRALASTSKHDSDLAKSWFQHCVLSSQN